MILKLNNAVVVIPRWSSGLGWKISKLARRVQIHLVTSEFFSFKIQETCTLTCVEQKVSLCVKKLKNFMRVYANRERAVCNMHEASLA